MYIVARVFQSPLFEHTPDMHPWAWQWGFHIGSFLFVLMALFWIGLIVAILLFIRWLVVSGSRRKGPARGEDSALEILRMRYAKGEIGREEFEQKKKDLGY